MGRTTRRLSSVGIGLVLAACGSSQLARESLPPISGLMITGNTGVPGPCDGGHVAERLDQLFDAITEGQADIAREYFGHGRGAPFRWFSFTERYVEPQRHYVTHVTEDLNDHFTRRHGAGERMRLRGVTFNRRDGFVHFGPIDFDFVVSDSDATNAGNAGVYEGTGKGAYHCPTESFVVLSLVAVPQGQGFRAPE